MVLSGFSGARVAGVRLDLDFDRIVATGYRRLYPLEGDQVFVVDEDGNEVEPPGRFEVEWAWPSFEPAVLRDGGWFAEGALVLHGGSLFPFLAGIGAGFVPVDPTLETLVGEVCKELDGVAPVTWVSFSEWEGEREGEIEFWRDCGMLGDLVVDDDLDGGGREGGRRGGRMLGHTTE